MNSCASAARAASTIARSLAPGLPQAISARTVSCRTSVSCGRSVTYSRSRAGGRSRIGVESSRTEPESGRRSAAASVRLVEAGRADGGAEPGARLHGQPPALGVPAVVRLGEHDVAERLLDHGGDRAVGDPAGARDVPDGAREAAGRQPEQRGEDKGGPGQVPAQPERRDRVEERAEGRGGGAGKTGDEHGLDRLDVTRQPGQQVPLPVPLEEVRRQLLYVVEDMSAQPHHEPLGHPRGERVARVGHDRARGGDAQPLQGRVPEGAQRPLLQGPVGEFTEQQHDPGHGERGQDRAQPHGHQPGPQPLGQRPEAPEGGTGGDGGGAVVLLVVRVFGEMAGKGV